MRPTNTVTRNSFTIEKDDNGAVQSSKCKFCKTKWKFYNATKMSDHLLSHCKDVPSDIKAAVAAQGSSTSKISTNENRLAEEEEERALESSGGDNQSDATTSTSSVKPSKRPLSMSQFMDRMTDGDGDKENLHNLLSRAMVISNLPFSTFATPEWVIFFKAIRPSYELPSDWNLRHSLLDKQYEEISNRVESQVEKAENVSILTDAYSNVRNEGIMAFIVTTPAPLFYHMSVPGTESKTSEYVSTELIKVIEKVGSEKVNGICTDNASVMKKAWQIIEKKYPHISCYGCAPHSLNLLSKDVCKLTSIKNTLKNCQKVVKAIKRSHVPLAIFTKKQKKAHGPNAVTLKLPGKTRWAGTEEMLTSLHKNKKELKETLIDSRVKLKDKSIKNTVLDEDFWDLVKSTRKLMRPIVRSIIYLEGDQRSIADVPTVLAIMQKEISDVLEDWPLSDIDVVQDIEDLVASRVAFTLKDVHLAANYLHPVYKGGVLPDHLKLRATKFIRKLAGVMKLDVGEVLANSVEFQQNEGLWSDPDIFEAAEHLKPHSWWKGFCNTQPVAIIAYKILQQPSSAAPVERLWSNFGLVHNKLRNRLKNSRTKKLVKIRWNLLLSRKNAPTSKKRKVVDANESFSTMSPSTYPLLKIPIPSDEDKSDEEKSDEDEDDDTSIDSVEGGEEDSDIEEESSDSGEWTDKTIENTDSD